MIALTGASGFIGKYLLQALIQQFGKDQVIAITSKPINGCNCIIHNNYNFGKDFFQNKGYSAIENIIHAGAFIPKQSSDSNNHILCNANITSTSALLNANLPNLKKFILISTLDVYGDNNSIISETSAINPASLYGSSKWYTEKMIETWSLTNNSAIQILRLGHVYGPGEEAYKKIIPVTINKLLHSQAPQIWGTGSELRSFIYIKDVIAAILKSLTLYKNMGPINIVSAYPITVRSLVDMLIGISKIKIDVEYIETKQQTKNLIFDNTKMKTFLLSQETPLEKGLLEEWMYMKNII